MRRGLSEMRLPMDGRLRRRPLSGGAFPPSVGPTNVVRWSTVRRLPNAPTTAWTEGRSPGR